eukprot:m.177929 g.177929  ORF g.177929 m.177929 type:complete len:864 (+) comp14449_c0_seq1:66-2657(+)
MATVGRLARAAGRLGHRAVSLRPQPLARMSQIASSAVVQCSSRGHRVGHRRHLHSASPQTLAGPSARQMASSAAAHQTPPQVEAVLDDLARSVRNMTPLTTHDDEGSDWDSVTTHTESLEVDLMSVAEEAQAITQARAELLSGPRGWSTDAETPTEWPPAGSPYADTVATVWQWMSESSRAGTVPYQYAADLEDLFQNIPASERLASELFTSGHLARSIWHAKQTHAAAAASTATTASDTTTDTSEEPASEAASESAGVVDSAALATTLSRCADAVALMPLGLDGIPEDRADVLRVKSMIDQLPPVYQLQYLHDLGGVNVGQFVVDVLPFASSVQPLLDALSAVGAGATDAPEEVMGEADSMEAPTTPTDTMTTTTAVGNAHADVWRAWRHTAPAVRRGMPATSRLAAECGRHVMGTELQSVVDGVRLERDWVIEGYTLRGSALRDDVRTVLEEGVFVKTLPRDEQGRLVSEADRQAVLRLQKLLPKRLRKEFDSADDLAQTLMDAYDVMDAKKTPHAEADAQYAQWIEFYGPHTPVPLDRAHAFFVYGEPLIAPEDVKREMMYRYPSPLHKPTVSDITEAPRQGQLFSDDVSDDVSSQRERKLLAQSPALYTSRIIFNDVLIWLERMQDGLDTVTAPLPPKPDETLEALEARRRVFDEKVYAGRTINVPTWATREEMSARVGGQLSISEHRTLTNTLTALWEHPYGGLVHADLVMFTRSAGKQAQDVRKSRVDKFGRGRALGRRKNAQAKVTVTEGTGQITVNGALLTDYFPRTIDRYEVIRPLMLTGLISSVDVACSTRGGGNTGQAGACRHAISRAIADMYPDCRATLKKALFLRRDPRMVERKKPGQPKARKKFQWVKR